MGVPLIRDRLRVAAISEQGSKKKFAQQAQQKSCQPEGKSFGRSLNVGNQRA